MIKFLLSVLLMLQLEENRIPKPEYLGNLMISIPEDAEDKNYPMLIVFGGATWATPKFLWENTPEEYFNKSILVYSPCFTYGGGNLKKVVQNVSTHLQKKGIKYSSKSACGFSGGGPDVMIVENPKEFRALGFIDPSPAANGTVRYSSNMILSFRRNNWINSDFYGKVVNFRHFNALSSNIRNAGGIVEEADIFHDKYFAYFLNKFRKQLIGE